MELDVGEQIEKFQEFIERHYQKALHYNVSKGHGFLVIDFFDLTKYDPKLADQLLEEPEETIKAAEIALEQFDVKKRFRVRFSNLPKSQEIFIRNLRSKHLGKLIAMEGIIRQSSEVRPQAVSAKFECPSCGNTITMPQIDLTFREPTRCSCGRKGKFRLLSKELVDVQRLVLEESPENLEGGAQPKRMSVFLREDLVEPRMEKRTTPGTRVIVTGSMYVVPIPNRTGGTSTRFDLAMAGNYLETVEEDFSEITISPEEEKEIRSLARDKKIYERLIASIAPSIFGHEKIKEAIMLQLFGGIRKIKKDGTAIRGDLHVLLIGDPGAGKTVYGETNIILAAGETRKISEYVNSVMTKPYRKDDCFVQDVNGEKVISLDLDGKICEKKIEKVWKKPMEILLKVKTRTGKEIICTKTNPFFVVKEGKIVCIKANELRKGIFVATPRKIKFFGKKKINLSFVGNKVGKNFKVLEKWPSQTSVKFWKFVGYLVGEGYCKFGDIRFTNSSNTLLRDFEDCLDALFDFPYNVRIREEKYKEYLLSSKNLSIFLEQNLGIDFHKNSREKRVPPLLFQCVREEIRAFLMAYFDGEAHVTDREIQVSSKSKKLLEDVRHLLLRFGIRVQLSKKVKYATNTVKKIKNNYFEIRISGEDLLTYYSEISFLSPEKIESLKKASYKESRNPNYDVVPNLSRLLKELRTKLRMTQFEMGVPRTTYQHYERGGRNPSRRSLRKVVDAILEKYLSLGVVTHSNIKSIKGLRTFLKLSQQDVVNNIGCSQTLVSQYELGKVKEMYRQEVIVSELLEKVCKIINDKSLKEKIKDLSCLANANIFWDQIESVQIFNSDQDWLYDLEVEETHNFVANDFYIHNSQMLTFVHKAAPKTRYVAGRSASGAGLTASVVKDEFLRGWALEAGAMVLADKGTLVLDEMDKISKEDTSALHEAMEQQQISIAKANIQATLRTQTSILAAANPKLGRFDPYTPVPNQIDMPPALINRFDLIFVLRDIPNKELDTNIATRVLESHSYKDPAPDIDAKFLRKYLAYTKQKCFPKLTTEATDAIKEFYVNLRSQGQTGDSAVKPIPISARQLEAIVRLAEASARIRLKDTVDKEDAIRAINLLKGCMAEIGVDPETGQLDMDRVSSGITASVRSRIIEVRNLVFQLCEEKQGPISIEDDLKPKVFDKGITEQKLDEAVDKLKRSGDVFEPKKGWLQKI